MENKFFAYYNSIDGTVLSVTNEISNKYKTAIEIPYIQFEQLVSGTSKFDEFRVGYIRGADDKNILALVPVTADRCLFKNNTFEWISRTPTSDTELIVTWDNPLNSWIFSASDISKIKMVDELMTSTLTFYVILDDDFNFLIRTINVLLSDLKVADVKVPFISNLENNIDKISITTQLVLESYGLIINE